MEARNEIMSIKTEIKNKLNNNQKEVFITDADELLAAWRYKRQNGNKKKCKLSRVPASYRCSTPRSDKRPMMPCHVTLRQQGGTVTEHVEPTNGYETIACHGHARIKHIQAKDLNTLEKIVSAKDFLTFWVSPIMDTCTLSLVCKDLGIMGKAIPKVIKGRQYIAFSGYPGLRSRFPGTIYSARNRKLISMGIGTLGIRKMVTKGAKITIYLSVGLTVLEAFLGDYTTVYEFFGDLASDLIKLGIASIMSAIIGLTVGGMTTIAFLPIAITIAVMIGTNYLLNQIDNHYNLTEKLAIVMEKMSNDMGEAIRQKASGAGTVAGQGLWGFFRSCGLRYQINY